MQTRAISDLPEYRHIIEHLVCTRLSSRFVAFRPAIINETGNLERKKYHNKRYSYHILRNAKPAPALLSLSRHPGLPRHAALLLAHGRGSNSPPCLVICISSGAADSPSGPRRRITPSPPWRTPPPPPPPSWPSSPSSPCSIDDILVGRPILQPMKINRKAHLTEQPIRVMGHF